jgi:surface protein
VTSWKTAKVTDMSYLFYKCSVLGSINVSYFNTANVEDMSYMFYGCSDLTILDLKKFSTAKVKNMSDMFFNCSSLKAIDCHSAWKCDNSDDMFRGCTSLKGVIAYDDSKTDATYANPISGYFTGILLGDVNDDGTVDDKDIAAVIRYILEGDSEGFNFAKADMNGDGVINVADIVLINAIKEK